MSRRVALLCPLLAVALTVACSPASGEDAGPGDGGATDGGGDADAGPADAGVPECFDLSTTDILALDGAFDATSDTWRRPYDEEAVCPATGLLPTTSAEVPVVAYTFCNHTGSAASFTIEMLSQDGPDGEPPVDDPLLFLYDGYGIPGDALQCRAVNDDFDPTAIDNHDAALEGVVVENGAAITVVGTVFQFDAADDTGVGGYILVVTYEG